MLNFPPGKESEDLDTPEDYTKLTQVESDLERKTGSEFDSQSAHADVQQDVQQDMRQELQRYVQQGVQLKEQQELQRELSYQNLQNQREGYS